MATFTSSLPDALLDRLQTAAGELQVPKNKLIEQALDLYLDQLKRAAYVKSYQQAGQDEEIMSIAEEGMVAYMQQLAS
ncbi:MAG: ribbon-helix-helix domain-containing protein [Cyclobacteriaceae bacterium]